MKVKRVSIALGLMMLPLAMLVEAPAGATQEPLPVFVAMRGGGLVPFGSDKRNLSDHIVNVDGSHYKPGGFDLQYPGPALYPLTVGKLSAAQLTELDQRVVAALLDATRVDYGIPNVVDAPSLAVDYRGNTKVIMSWGVGEEGLTPKQRQNRAAVREVLSWLDGLPTKVMVPTAVVMTAQSVSSGDVPSDGKVVDWPKTSISLASVKECVVLTGKQGKAAATLLVKLNTQARYRSKGKIYVVYARAYVPGDRGCPK